MEGAGVSVGDGTSAGDADGDAGSVVGSIEGDGEQEDGGQQQGTGSHRFGDLRVGWGEAWVN
jgi:hypothetical protein